MKKFTAFMAAVALSVFGAVASTFEYEFNETNVTAAGFKKLGAYTLNGVSWTFASTSTDLPNLKYNTGKGLQFGSGNKPCPDLTVSTTGIPGTITSVTVDAVYSSQALYNCAISVGGTEVKSATDISGTVGEAPVATGAISAQGEIKIVFTKTNEGSGNLTLNKITVVYNDGTGPQVYYPSFADMTLAINQTADLNFGSAHPDFTFTPSAEGVVSIADGKITGLATGTATIAVTWGASDEYQAGETSFEATVTTDKMLVFDFTKNSYGLTPSSSYATADATITNAPISIALSGSYALNPATNKKDQVLALANDYDGRTPATATVSIPNGYIKEVAFAGGNASKVILAENQPGTFKSGVWTNADEDVKSVMFAIKPVDAADAKDASANLSTISVIYGGYSGASGIESVAEAAVSAGQSEYFNLNGVRVDASNLIPGIYVVRQGDKTSKVIIR